MGQYVRRRNGFSDRNGINPISKEVQIEFITDDSRVVIKNKILSLLNSYRGENFDYDFEYKNWLSNELAVNLFNKPLNSPSSSYENIMKTLSIALSEGTYDEVLDIVEFICEIISVDEYGKRNKKYLSEYHKQFNKLFEDEYIGYRFVNGIIIANTNETENKEITQAANSKFDKVNSHLNNALLLLSNKGNRDYKNSIKESVCALEELLSNYGNHKNDTLSKMISSNDVKAKLHPTLVEAIQKIYWFTCDEDGIRHGNGKDSNDIDFEEAKYILVTASALVNYLIYIFEDK